MSLAAIYNVWDGDELLAGSIRQIRASVDDVIVVWQAVSNFGEVYTPTLPFELIDVAVPYEPDLQAHAPGQSNETRKRNLGIQTARGRGHDAFILMDCDEYYEPVAFRRAYDAFVAERWEVTVAHLETYYKFPTCRLTPREDYRVPMFARLREDTRVYPFQPFPWRVDPTRKITTAARGSCIEYAPESCVMHHFSWVRRNLARKLRNSSAKVNWLEAIPAMLAAYDAWQPGLPLPTPYAGHAAIEVPDHFGLGSAEHAVSCG